MKSGGGSGCQGTGGREWKKAQTKRREEEERKICDDDEEGIQKGKEGNQFTVSCLEPRRVITSVSKLSAALGLPGLRRRTRRKVRERKGGNRGRVKAGGERKRGSGGKRPEYTETEKKGEQNAGGGTLL
ncbi:Hypothetical predicted protein [Xyrichtys novacula]|uniref:Uncharacterized protein n=1 Tax=Xyrichtys novacula TaxID=13765 RepID=A0AAV1HP14_XYRNO|nr:Hypothetical predicted protein [Xyrichtys novacula]